MPDEENFYTVTTLPLGPQSTIPTGYHEWEWSWSRTKSTMRLRGPVEDTWQGGEGEWFCKASKGKTVMLGCDHDLMRMHLYGKAQLSSDMIEFWAPPTYGADIPVDAQPLGDSHWRLCARVPLRDWRLRDERTNELIMVKDYSGHLNMDWNDGGSHIFHDGLVYLGRDGVAYFKPSEAVA